jgi:hypothetical protein
VALLALGQPGTVIMADNQINKKRGMAHHLHKQWIATKIGAELHAADVARQKALPKKTKIVK